MSKPASHCPFCTPQADEVLHEHPLALVLRDTFPASPGHTLVVPRRHVGSFFELDEAERAAMLTLLDRAHADVRRDHAPDGYTIGINDGPAAGQTVPHVHLHLIPRYHGDVENPRGGIRWVLPAKAKYRD